MRTLVGACEPEEPARGGVVRSGSVTWVGDSGCFIPTSGRSLPPGCTVTISTSTAALTVLTTVTTP